MKRTYRSPLSSPTEVTFEQALLVTTTRLTEYVDETENVNITTGDGPTSETYFEF